MVKTGDPHWDPKEMGELSKYYPNAQFFHLGGGGWGNVFRVVPKDGSPEFAIKKSTASKSEIEGMKLLKKAFQSLSDSPFGVVSMEATSQEGIARFEYIPGRDVISLAKKRPELKKYLIEAYRERFKQGRIAIFKYLDELKMSKKIQSYEEAWTPNIHPDFESVQIEIFLQGGKKITIWLKADNVIITPDGTMFIVDPY